MQNLHNNNTEKHHWNDFDLRGQTAAHASKKQNIMCVGVDVNIVIVLSVNGPLLWLAHLAFSAMEVHGS